MWLTLPGREVLVLVPSVWILVPGLCGEDSKTWYGSGAFASQAVGNPRDDFRGEETDAEERAQPSFPSPRLGSFPAIQTWVGQPW